MKVENAFVPIHNSNLDYLTFNQLHNQPLSTSSRLCVMRTVLCACSFMSKTYYRELSDMLVDMVP